MSDDEDLFRPKQEWYFDSARFHWKVLRALNLLEPDRTVISFSKAYAWGSVIAFFLTIWVYYETRDYTAMGAMAATGLNVVVAIYKMVQRDKRKDE